MAESAAEFPHGDVNAILSKLAAEIVIGVAKLTVKELIKRLGKEKGNRMKELLSRMKIKYQEDDLVVNIRVNPSLYGMLGKPDFYKKYVLLEEENGTVILDKKAETFLNDITVDPELFEFTRLRETLDSTVNGQAGILNILGESMKVAQDKNDAKLSTDLQSQIHRIKEEWENVNHSLNNLVSAKVKASEFQNSINRIIERSIYLTDEVSRACTNVLDKFGVQAFSTNEYKDGSQGASYQLTACTNASIILDRLAFRWDYLNNRSLLNPTMSKFMASLIREMSKQNSKKTD